MQSSPTSDRLDSRHEQFISQHSPQRGISSSSPVSNPHDGHTLQQFIPTISRDTTPVATTKAGTPPSAAQSNSSISSLTGSTSSAASSVSIGSVLSPTAPQFKRRLIDSPIDLRELSISSSGSSAGSLGGAVEGTASDMLDVSQSVQQRREGLINAQESVSPKNIPTMSATVPLAASPSLTSGSPALSSTSTNDTFRTPNVYINGLPPNFPEDQLLAMTREFGEVMSVRTFTRHVSDKPSGYGFVLFGSVDAAERCIETLRKYRNLHPSFSKQVHKIPGTVYATVNASSPVSTEPPDSFKARMERLKDPSSTNLYIEGLPLSIDEASLAALVSPFRIMSSRLFQTRLSNPPRIIAFVRLESRDAAEDVVERLHGRMVRGWNDPGSRISVRFADNAEQRELRRMERMTREDESSPARLTMAQAALLNLKGTQLNPSAQSPRISSPNFGLSPPMCASLSLTPELAPRSLPPPIGLHHHAQDQPIDVQGLSSALRNVHLQDYSGFNTQAADFAGAGLRMPAHLLATDPAVSQEMLQMAMGIGAGSATRARNGFTPMEQLLLQAHAQRQEIPPRALGIGRSDMGRRLGQESEFNVAALEFNPSANTLRGLQSAANANVRQGGARLMDYLPSMSEEDFHASARGNQQSLSVESNISPVIAPPKSERTVSRLTLDEASRNSFTRQRNLTHAEARAQAQGGQTSTLHTRSTTVPSHYPSADRTSTQPFLNTRGNANQSTLNSNTATTLNGLSSISKNTSYSASTTVSNNTSSSTLLRNGNNVSINNSSQHNHDTIRDSNTSRLADTKNSHTASQTVRASKGLRSEKAEAHQPSACGDTAVNGRPAAHTRSAISRDADEEGESSGLDSPALSYSVRTPASLSPATPFSAFGETFDGPPMTALNVAASGNEVGLGVGVGLSGIQQKPQPLQAPAATVSN